MSDRTVGVRDGLAEHLQSLVLRGRSEREVARVRQKPLRFDDPVDLILNSLVLVCVRCSAERTGHGSRGLRPLGRVSFVDNDREVAALMLRSDVVEDVGELLHRGDDDLLARLNRAAKITRAGSVDDRRADLQERLDCLG